jgi:hypothetical protein
MKKSYLQITDETRKHIVSAPFIAVQRIVGDKLHCMFINDGEYFVENHVNVITGNVQNLKTVFKSLCLEKTNKFIKEVLSNTQVSKNELQNIVQIYPDLA